MLSNCGPEHKRNGGRGMIRIETRTPPLRFGVWLVRFAAGRISYGGCSGRVKFVAKPPLHAWRQPLGFEFFAPGAELAAAASGHSLSLRLFAGDVFSVLGRRRKPRNP